MPHSFNAIPVLFEFIIVVHCYQYFWRINNTCVMCSADKNCTVWQIICRRWPTHLEQLASRHSWPDTVSIARICSTAENLLVRLMAAAPVFLNWRLRNVQYDMIWYDKRRDSLQQVHNKLAVSPSTGNLRKNVCNGFRALLSWSSEAPPIRTLHRAPPRWRADVQAMFAGIDGWLLRWLQTRHEVYTQGAR